MPFSSLSDATVRSLKGDGSQRDIWDTNFPGFGIRISQGGGKSFILKHKNRRITIGKYGILSLAEARQQAKLILAEATLGRIRPQSITYEQAVKLYLEDKARVRRPSTVNGYRRLLGRLNFKGQLSDISPTEFSRRLDRFKAVSERDHMLVAAKAFFNWCRKRRYVTDDPSLGLSKGKPRRRERVLTDDEIRALFKTEGMLADYCKGLLLTGLRRSELRHVTIDQDTFTVPADFSKNHQPLTLPICPLARPYIRPYTDYFDWSKLKKELDEASGIQNWQLKDLRRTFRTGLSKLGVNPWVAERLVNHLPPELHRVYDQYDWRKEFTEALLKWEAYVAAL